jgi:hypothetical protein
MTTRGQVRGATPPTVRAGARTYPTGPDRLPMVPRYTQTGRGIVWQNVLGAAKLLRMSVHVADSEVKLTGGVDALTPKERAAIIRLAAQVEKLAKPLAKARRAKRAREAPARGF